MSQKMHKAEADERKRREWMLCYGLSAYAAEESKQIKRLKEKMMREIEAAESVEQLEADVLQNLTLAYAVGGMDAFLNLGITSLDMDEPDRYPDKKPSVWLLDYVNEEAVGG